MAIPVLKGIITDTHFAKRNRMGRLLVFLARLKGRMGKLSGVSGVEQAAAVLLEPSGAAKVVGKGGAYFVDAGKAAGILAKGAAFAYGPFSVEKVEPGHSFNVKALERRGHSLLALCEGWRDPIDTGGRRCVLKATLQLFRLRRTQVVMQRWSWTMVVFSGSTRTAFS